MIARLAPFALLALSSCSLTTYDYTPCTENRSCRDAFGFGYVCGAKGLCTELEVEPRCNRVYPVDLFQRAEKYRDAIVLGSLFDRDADMPEIQAAQLAVMQVDDLSGLDGHPFGLVGCTYEENTVYDDRDMESAATFTADWLSDTVGVPAIIGPGTSAMAEAAYYEAAPAGTLLISPSATSTALTTIDGLTKSEDDPGLFWRTAAPDALQGAVIASDMLDRGTRSVAVIDQTGSYGEGLATAFEAAFTAAGGTVTLHPFADDAQRDAAVVAVDSVGADEVLFISSEPSDLSSFLDSAVVLAGYTHLPIFFTDTGRDTQILSDARGARALFDQVRGTAPSIPAGPVYDFFSAAYAGAFAPDVASALVFTAHAWDAGWLALYGAAWAQANEGAITGTGIARGLRHVSAGTPIDISPSRWTEVTATFGEGGGIDVTGASGALDYDPATEETTAPIDVWTITTDGGSFTTQYTTDP